MEALQKTFYLLSLNISSSLVFDIMVFGKKWIHCAYLFYIFLYIFTSFSHFFRLSRCYKDLLSISFENAKINLSKCNKWIKCHYFITNIELEIHTISSMLLWSISPWKFLFSINNNWMEKIRVKYFKLENI